MRKFLKKLAAGMLCAAMLLSTSCAFFGGDGGSGDNPGGNGGNGGNGGTGNVSDYIINKSDIPLMLWYDEEAPTTATENHPIGTTRYPLEADDSWEEWSLPIGNGYFGANIFGRTETERIQLSEKTITNPNEYIDGTSIGGLNNFSETYIDFGHKNSRVSEYKRYLDLKTAISGVEYVYEGVKYTRELFTSYPDKVLVIRLDADTQGALSFTLRPTIPYEQDYMTTPGDNISKHGTVVSTVENGVGKIELTGKMGYYDIDFMGLYKVYTTDGTVKASTTQHTYEDTAGVSHTDTDGTIVVENATSAYIVVTLDTDYQLTEELFTSDDDLNNCLKYDNLPAFNTVKPTYTTGLDFTRARVEAAMTAAEAQLAGKSYYEGYAALKSRHIEDYSALFGRMTLNIDCDPIDYKCTTDDLLDYYSDGYESNYIETLLFQYGRYMLIASSRAGSVPAHLQGVWNTYNSPPWASNYTHNINVQMNYWPAFSTNLAETFQPYVDYSQAYMTAAGKWADLAVIWNDFSSRYNKDGDNGWVIGHAATPYRISYDSSPGNVGFTTQLFWEQYAFTMDKEQLREIVYPMLYSAAQFITKMVIQDADGHYLVAKCDSPEQYVNGQWYFTSGTTYAQSFSYLNNYHLLLAAKELGIDLEDNGVLSKAENEVLKTVLQQIDKYDPIIVGLSGQIKEFREEQYYGDLGEYQHRHIAHLVSLFPGNIINSTTPAWIDAAKVTLTERGIGGVGWAAAWKVALWARTKDGDTAHQILSELISVCMAPNLWDLHMGESKDTFQIDGNFGATAAIAEMLLQSDSGYVEPLAALPSAWTSGSYTGLVARGNFEVSAEWENGTATLFNITSRSGERLSVYYPTVAGARVCTPDGKDVPFAVENNNLISFDTVVGETYILYGFEEQVKPNAPTDFKYEREGLGEFSFSWKPSFDAAEYNIYVAVESQPDYTLLGTTEDISFSYTPTEDENARMTFALTAVSEDGAESNRILCYFNPVMSDPDNILSGKKFVGAPGTSYDTNDGLDFSYAKLTDGDFGQNYGNDNWKYGRFSTLPNGHADGTVDLLGSYILSELRIYLFQGGITWAGTDFTLQVFSDGVWIDVYKDLTNEQLSSYHVSNGSLNNQRYLCFDMGNIKAEKIRFFSRPLPNNTVTWYEIECSGSKV